MRTLSNVYLSGVYYRKIFVSRHANERLEEYGISRGLIANIIRNGSLVLTSVRSRFRHFVHESIEIVFDELTRTIVTFVIHASSKTYRPKPKIKDIVSVKREFEETEIEIQEVKKILDHLKPSDRDYGVSTFKRLFAKKLNPKGNV